MTLEIIGDTQIKAKFEALPASVHDDLLRTVYKLDNDLVRYIQDQKLSGQVLKIKTGALRRSIKGDVIDEGDIITGTAFSSGDVLKYAGIHEYGGTTPPHDIVPVKAKALAFVMGGKMVFAKIVHHPGSKMPERSFMRSSLSDNAQYISDEMALTVNKSVKS